MAQGGNPFDTGGRDDKPAGEVFKNIQALKNMHAGRLAGVMNGWTKALSVKCNHCHTPGAWEKEDVPAKEIAREMVALTYRINNESLKAIKNLKSEKPTISCYTCHRGAVMAGCTPEMMPLLLRLVQAACDERFNLHGCQATTHFAAPLVIINGPVRHQLGFVSSGNVFSLNSSLLRVTG